MEYFIDIIGITEVDLNLTADPVELSSPTIPTDPADLANATQDIFLSRMAECFKQNIQRMQAGHRYFADMRLYAAYIRMLSGRLAYETLKANACHSIPSISAIDRYIASVESVSIEGVLRVDELAKYLHALNLPPFVALSEDATRVINRIQWDSRTNKIVGVVLPIGKNGMPITNINYATSAAEIEKSLFDVKTGKAKQRASYLNLVMAQPLAEGIPPFCLLLFGSDDILQWT